MVTITIKDHLTQWMTNSDGYEIYCRIKPELKAGNKVKISFKGVDAVPSSFINSAFIDLLDDFDFEFIKTHLSFIDSSSQINALIKKRFHDELNHQSH